jgi:hypothetical protein
VTRLDAASCATRPLSAKLDPDREPYGTIQRFHKSPHKETGGHAFLWAPVMAKLARDSGPGDLPGRFGARRPCPPPGCACMLVAGSSIMKSNSPHWVWVAYVLALLTISYVVMPPSAFQHAAALWGR